MDGLGYTPPTRRLRGLSVGVAECYGKPHVGALYKGSGVKGTAVKPGACCACCGLPATNAHHCPPLHWGRTLSLSTPCGSWTLRPALIALCGSGTTGCHNGFHGGARYVAEWRWLSDEFMRQWWEGELLSRLAPHDKGLYGFGFWRVFDKFRGGFFEVRA